MRPIQLAEGLHEQLERFRFDSVANRKKGHQRDVESVADLNAELLDPRYLMIQLKLQNSSFMNLFN